MKKLIIAGAICLVALLAVTFGGLLYMKLELASFPEFEITAEKTSLSNDEIFGWIEQIVAFGPRKPAMAGDEKTREFITAKFHEFGLTVEEPEPIDVETQHVNGWSFSLKDKKTGEEIEIPTHYIPFPAPTPAQGIEAELVYIGEGEELDEIDMEGKIVVFDQAADLQEFATLKNTFFSHDPAGTIGDDHTQLHQRARHERIIHDKVVARGAIGMVGLLPHLQWESDGFCPQMNRGVSKRIPGYWVSPTNSKMVKEWLERDDVVGTMKMDSELGRSQSYNVWATLPGETDENYIVMGHYDAPFANAVQDASGTCVMLALAKHFSQVAQERPLKRGIIFLAIGAHTLGRLGEIAFVEEHRDDILPKSALVVSIEHIGKDFVPQDDLSFRVSDLPSPRLIMTASNDNLNGIVKSSILHNDYRRSVILPQWVIKQTTGKARGISGEFYEAGAPTVGILPNPQYIFFTEDTPDAVARDQLVPTADLVISMLRAADELPLDELK
jgi:hypothetical protein